VFATGERAVTKEDFIAILENYAGIANANVWGELEEAEAAGTTADYEMLNKVNISIVLQNWGLADSDFEDILATFLYEQSVIAIRYDFIDPTILLVIPVLEVLVVSGNSLSDTQDAIETQLAIEFLLGTNTRLGQTMKYSNILSGVDDLDSVSYLNMVLEIRQSLVTGYDSNYDYGAALNALSILPEATNLYIGDDLVATDVDQDDGTGTFTSEVSGWTVSGTITYETGVIVVDITEAVGTNEVFVRYRQDEDGNIVPTFNQIAMLYDTVFTSIAIDPGD